MAQLRATENLTQLARYSQELYQTLEAETGQATGFRQCGAISVASNAERFEEIQRQASMAACIEAGLSFACDLAKDSGFIGKEALLVQKQQGVNKRLVQFLLEDSERLMYRAEPIYRDGVLCGYTSSATCGHTLGAAVALGYVKNKGGVNPGYVNSGSYEIEVAGQRYPAKASLRPLYDPQLDRVRGS